MGFNYLSLIHGLWLLLFSMQAAALDYVPPPNGPYQSSNVINSQSIKNQREQQVYRFPPADLMTESRPKLSTHPSFSLPSGVQNPINSITPPMQPVDSAAIVNTTQPQFQSDNLSPSGDMKQPENLFYPPLSENPWAVGTQDFQNNFQNPWGQQNYQNSQPYQNMNPNYYQNQKNMNTPFSGMPTPWQVMPMQPFFSGQQNQ